MANTSLRVLKSFIKYKTVQLGTMYSIWWKIIQNLQSCMSLAYIFSSVSHLRQIYTCINKDRALRMSIKGLDTKYSIIMYLYNLHTLLKNHYWHSVVTLTFLFLFFIFITNTILTIQYDTPLTLITMQKRGYSQLINQYTTLEKILDECKADLENFLWGKG